MEATFSSSSFQPTFKLADKLVVFHDSDALILNHTQRETLICMLIVSSTLACPVSSKQQVG
jgi:hypothetical protein